MRAMVGAANLRDAIAAASAGLPGRTTIEVLKSFRIEAGDDRVSVTASNLDEWVTAHAPAEVERLGVVLVDGRTLAALVAKMGDAPTTLSLDSKGLSVRGGGVSSRLTTTNEAYPRLHESKQPEARWALPYAQLSAIAQRVPFAAGDLDPAGVCWWLRDGRMEAVATDRHTIALQGFPCDGTTAQAVLAPAALPLAAKLLAGDDSVAVAHCGDWLEFRGDRVVFMTRLLTNSYPDVRPFFASLQAERVVHVDRAALLNAVAVADLVAHELTHRVKVEFDADSVTVSAISERGDSSEMVRASMQGDPITLEASATKVTAALRRIPTTSVRLEIASALQPIVFSPADAAAGEDQRIAVMPFNQAAGRPEGA